MSPTLPALARRALVPAAFALAACTPSPARDGHHATTPKATIGSPVDRAFEAYLAAAPSIGRDAGMHEYDGRVRDYSTAAIGARIAAARRDRDALGAADRRAMSPDAVLDLEILRWALEEELFDLEERALFRTDPAFYGELFDVATYLDNDGVPLERRTERVIRHEEAALREVPRIYENLRVPLSRPVAEVAAGIFEGYAESLRGDIAERVRAGTNAEQRARFEKANTALAKEADRLATWLRREVIPHGNDSHVLGRARFEKLVSLYAGTSLTLERFKAIGQADLDRNKRAYDTLAKTIVPKRPSEADYLTTASRMVSDARAFIETQHVVTMPTKDHATVRESPPYKRYNQAWIESYGPFDTESHASFFDLTLPDPAWSPEKRQGYISTFGALRATVVHEVYPGHFVQIRWLDRAPSRIQKTIGSLTFSEGWAHYTEQMMVDVGFGAEDPQTRMGQLHDALLRNCRFMVSIGIHTEGMTLDQAEKRFMTDCAQESAPAHEQAMRATFHPWYFAYTLGKLQILALRRRAEEKLGARFSLQKFHDALLSHGGPPVGLIERRVLDDLGASN